MRTSVDRRSSLTDPDPMSRSASRAAPCPLVFRKRILPCKFRVGFLDDVGPSKLVRWKRLISAIPFFRSADFSNFPTTILNSRRDVEPLARRNNTRSHGLRYRYRWKNLRRRTGLHLFSAQQAASGEKWRGYSSHRDGVFALCIVTPTSLVCDRIGRPSCSKLKSCPSLCGPVI